MVTDRAWLGRGLAAALRVLIYVLGAGLTASTYARAPSHSLQIGVGEIFIVVWLRLIHERSVYHSNGNLQENGVLHNFSVQGYLDRMRTAYRVTYGPPSAVTIKDLQIPQPQADELLVRVHAASVSHGPTFEYLES